MVDHSRTGVANFGWPRFEGVRRRMRSGPPRTQVPPRLTLSHEVAHAIVGGVVVPRSSLRAVRGRYIFGDFCDGRISVADLTRKRCAASG